MVLLNSTMTSLGTPAYDFALEGTDGKTYSLDSFSGRDVLVIIFMCNHCPYVKAVLKRLIDLQNEFSDRGVQLVGINPNDTVRYPDDSLDNMKALAKEKGFPFPHLMDPSQETAKAYDAVCTPDLYVYGKERKLLYRGRIDDNWEHPEKVTRQDLKSALENIIAGQPVSSEQIPSMGCSIKWITS
ncbi:MAG: thioredoxin family protein [Nitrospinaceae bacterium]|nr:thioredoxin family protein [Nitrospinaceae bacterium]